MRKEVRILKDKRGFITGILSVAGMAAMLIANGLSNAASQRLMEDSVEELVEKKLAERDNEES